MGLETVIRVFPKLRMNLDSEIQATNSEVG